MTEHHKRILALFDVDGTLTVPRQVRKIGEPAPPAVEFLQELRQVTLRPSLIEAATDRWADSALNPM